MKIRQLLLGIFSLNVFGVCGMTVVSCHKEEQPPDLVLSDWTEELMNMFTVGKEIYTVENDISDFLLQKYAKWNTEKMDVEITRFDNSSFSNNFVIPGKYKISLLSDYPNGVFENEYSTEITVNKIAINDINKNKLTNFLAFTTPQFWFDVNKSETLLGYFIPYSTSEDSFFKAVINELTTTGNEFLNHDQSPIDESDNIRDGGWISLLATSDNFLFSGEYKLTYDKNEVNYGPEIKKNFDKIVDENKPPQGTWIALLNKIFPQKISTFIELERGAGIKIYSEDNSEKDRKSDIKIGDYTVISIVDDRMADINVTLEYK